MDRSPDSPSQSNAPGSLFDDGWFRNQDRQDRERAIVGSMLGTAVGDAIGLPYEGLSPRRAGRLLGPPDRHRFLFGRGMVSDDTEHTCMVAQSLIESQNETEFANELGRRLRNWVRMMPAGIGLATLRACAKLNVGISPLKSGVYSAGNGPAMRAAILGAAVDDLEKLRKLVAVSTRMTHIDPRAEDGAMAVALAARMARSNQPLSPFQFVAELKQLCSPQASQELIDFASRAAESVERRESSHIFANSIGLGNGVSGYVNHTVPVALHAWWSHPTDFRAAIESVILCGGDADTTAAIVGGITGAAVGRQGIPADWLNGVWEWPRSVQWMEGLAVRLANIGTTSAGDSAPNLSWLSTLARNVFFAGTVLTHGFRRLLPPY